MRNLIFKNTFGKTVTMVVIVFSLLAVSGTNAQEQKMSGSDLEKLQDENMDYLKQIHEIIEDYPAFSYSYNFDDGELKDVKVTGVEDIIDRKKLEVMLFDLKSNKNMIKTQANRVGVFYSVDKEPQYKGGRDELKEKIMGNLKYPEDAKNWGVEGTVYVKFVVDEEGEIPFVTTSTNIETSVESYLKDLEKQAVSAVKATSGDWNPGTIDGVKVSSLAVLPVTFDFQKNPSIISLIP